MPWNCLCSSDKERHKLEISAPILNRDGSAKIIQTSSNVGHSKKITVPSFQRNSSNQVVEIVSNNHFRDDSKLHIKSASKQQKQQRSKKNVKNAKEPNAKFQNGNNQQHSHPTNSFNFINNKTIDLNGNASLNANQHHDSEEDDTTYSQLVLEHSQVNKSTAAAPSAGILSTNNLKTIPSESTTTLHVPKQNHDLNNTGHYDRLPFDKSSPSPCPIGNGFLQRTNANHVGQQPQVPQTHDQHYYKGNQNATGGAGGNNDHHDANTIPFIDEEDVVSIVEKHGTHLLINEGDNNNYETAINRVLTLHPKNTVSSQTIQRGKVLQRTQLSNMSLRKPRSGEFLVNGSSAGDLPLYYQKQHNDRAGADVHDFIAWNPAKGKLCQVCHASAFNVSKSVVKCRCCDFVCHHWCVPKIMKPNEDRVDSSQQLIPKLETQPWVTQTLPAPGQHKKSASLPSPRIHYVTERILAYILPSAQNGNHFDANDQYEKEVIPMLEQKHGQNYKLFNLETCISVITLERICELCKHIDKWLGSGQEKVVVLQDREDCQRLGATIIAFLEYLRICASNYQTRHINLNEDAQVQNTIARNWMNLDMFSMKKFLEGNIEPLRIPSYKRYIRYFSGLLSGQIKLNASPLHLNSISIESPPSFLQYNGVSSKSEWSSFIKIYEGLQCVYTSDIHIIPITTRQFLYQIGNLRLRGDILIRCYQIGSSGGSYESESKKLMFSVQFHTCAIKTNDVVFVKEDLDCAFDEPQFPNDCKVSFHFNSGNNNNFLFQSPLIRTERLHDVEKANSIENLDLNSCHTQGPLDGSLYATILKSPKSSHCPNYIHDESIKSIASYDTNFDSLNNNKTIKTSTPIKVSSRSDITSERQSFRETSAPLPTRSDYNTQLDNNRPGTSQSSFRHHSGNPKTTLLHHQKHNAVVIQTPDSNNRTSQNGSREFVRSPLTLSMDSGISSSGGVLSRPTLASSVSPSSFPSQVSPQEDRHRELDDILSDMLLTVQDIPDFQNRKSSTHSINQYDRSQSVVSHVSGTTPASSPVYTLPIPNTPAHNTNRELIHNSHSYVSQENVQRHSNSNSYNKQDRFDPYDTASTTTTLTPPPSESGRDTPNLFGGGYHSSTSNISLVQQSRQQQQPPPPRRETNTASTMPLQHGQMTPQKNSQHQSATYQRVVRTSKETNPITSEDEDNIPYHAREHSQPFTYGNLPSNGVHLNDVNDPDNLQKDPRMIKAQSGLTSPMLVRKTFGGGVSSESTYNTLRKPDFEEMLRERREKVMSEKYSISDKQTVASNGYQNYYNDPLKRSNTLDGFHRSTSTNELSGQTWLQLQQQKLRAKKNAQLKDDRKYFEEIHTEIKNRPLRSRNNARYDGYASDTAAFDEVDYRRPLHVQTPYHTSNSSPERHYHTISTTTKTVTKERPFVAVRRSHESAKQEKLGSPSLSPLAILNASPLGHIAHAQQSNNIRKSNNNINNNSSNQNQNGLLSLAESSLSNGRARLVREESFSSYRSETDQDISIAGSPRPETPAFPVTPRTPYGLHNGSNSPGIPPRSPTPQRVTFQQKNSKDIYGGTHQKGLFQEISNQNDTIYRTRMNSNASNANSEPQEVAPHLVKFVRDSSKFWYKPNLSREEAIDLLRNATPGTFIVRDSTTFKNAYGLVVRVAQPPPGVTASPGSDELVRHFLVEPTTRGVRLKGCANEPVFSSLSALVYQHSITNLALPCRLIIPESDIQPVDTHTPAQKQLLTQGAACNVLYLYSCGTESLTGEEAVRRAVAQLFSTVPLPKPTEVHFKVAQQGITLTDNTRQKFFRKHYTAHNISFCGTDPEHRQWSVRTDDGAIPVSKKTIFAFVARRSPSSKDNQCHVFCDLAISQPATAIVSFANKVLPTEQQPNRNI
ncbi:tensin-1 isoform X3 [Eupeodes corollae]|uniref:tensin-1 isoform X3 n=1 Tax=Eupeodes corollae TaxID=290404 RepID=UPI0024921D4B|nr:tensin-1 isoform X3 [Eupeodes corollae]